MNRSRPFALLLLIPLLALGGCSSSRSDETTTQGPGKEAILHEVGGLIRAASGEGRAPKRVADLARYETGYPLGFAAVKSGDVVVVWGATMAGEGEAATAPANVVAYEKKTPTEGGWVLLQNGTVKEMTVASFTDTPKAK